MPAHTPLPLDATLRTVLSTLDDPVNFVAKACAVINHHQREHGPVALCIGVSAASKGKRPNYRINDAATGDLVAVINGDTHQPWPDKAAEFGGEWSRTPMSYGQVRELLIELRKQEQSR